MQQIGQQSTLVHAYWTTANVFISAGGADVVFASLGTHIAECLKMSFAQSDTAVFSTLNTHQNRVTFINI